MTQTPLYVLAGGRARRFGRDKALEPIDGQPMLHRVIDSLRPAFARVTLVMDREDRYAIPDTRRITDQPPDIGPIGGLHAALQDLQSQHGEGWLFLASCDLIRPQPAWVRPLLDARTPDADVVAYRTDRWETMFAFYHTRLLPRVAERIDARHYALQRLCDDAAAIAAPLPEGLTGIPQANTPEELRRALADEAPPHDGA